jgi:hypothetical protein
VGVQPLNGNRAELEKSTKRPKPLRWPGSHEGWIGMPYQKTLEMAIFDYPWVVEEVGIVADGTVPFRSIRRTILGVTFPTNCTFRNRSPFGNLMRRHSSAFLG